MPVRDHTPIQPARGGLVHAVLVSGDTVGRTLCRRRYSGWRIATGPVTCLRCRALLKGPR